MKKKIIIVGYPKSGNTWLTRLTAELVDCPVKGFLYEESHPEIAIEGLDRKSEYECYKSHHQINELSQSDLEYAKIIYVYRDPRDLVISGQNYFYNYEYFTRFLYHKNSMIRKFFVKVNYLIKITFGLKLMKKDMIQAILQGNKDVHYWCRVSWKEHFIPYKNNPSILKMKYESMLINPVEESKNILKFIGIDKSIASINQAIQNQSFSNVKKKFSEHEADSKGSFLRKGASEQWRKTFSRTEKQIFLNCLSHELKSLGYSLE